MNIDEELDVAEKEIDDLESLRADLAKAIAELQEVERKADELLDTIKKVAADGG